MDEMAEVFTARGMPPSLTRTIGLAGDVLMLSFVFRSFEASSVSVAARSDAAWQMEFTATRKASRSGPVQATACAVSSNRCPISSSCLALVSRIAAHCRRSSVSAP